METQRVKVEPISKHNIAEANVVMKKSDHMEKFP